MKLRGALWWIDRWRSSSAYMDLSAEAQGLYRNLCDEVWLRDGNVIPEGSLARASGFPELWKKHRVAILAHMTEQGGGWTSATALEVIKQSEDLRERQRSKGKKRAAGASRGLEGTFQPDGQPGASREVQPKATLPSPSPSPSPEQGQEQEQTTDSSTPPAPSLVCPGCGSLDTLQETVTGSWRCEVEGEGCETVFSASQVAQKPPDGARTKARRNEQLATREPPKKQRGGYVGRACDIWTEIKGGVVAPGRMGSALKPLVASARKRHPELTSDAEAWEKIEPYFRSYLETTDDGYCSPEAFAKAPRAGTGRVSAKARARDAGMRAGIEGGLREE